MRILFSKASGPSGRIAFVLTAALFLAPTAYAAEGKVDGDAAHTALLSESSYPNAGQCAECHEQIYNEWASSNHAYASISPMFHKFEQAITDLSRGTIGTFCVRCHQTVGTQLGEQREAPLWERSQLAREGITCITCHRVKEQYSKMNGERTIEAGDIHQPVYSTKKDSSFDAVIAKKDENKLKIGAADDPQRGADIHAKVVKFEQLGQSEFCMSCHQVAVNLGIKLEIVWEQYRDSPAFEAGVTCQDCHMGKVPGRADGYAKAPAAVINGEPVNPERKHSNHAFYGPGYPIAHPGIFPHNPKAQKRASIQEWLQFDWRAGWGTKKFERQVKKGEIDVTFPKKWRKAAQRRRARKIIETNLKELEHKRELRRQVMENGSHIDGPFFNAPPQAGSALSFSYKVSNVNSGHNLPSGSLGAQPELWLNVALIDPDGKNVWESGYVDSNGDMADLHSLDVAAGKIEHDDQLFNLQTKFLTTNVKGTDREMYLPVNFDVDQIPFLRPPAVPTTVLNHPPFVRMENRSLPPLSSRNASYKVPAGVMTKAGTYRLGVRLRSRAEPIYFMRFVGATPEMEEAMNQWMLDAHAYVVEFDVK